MLDSLAVLYKHHPHVAVKLESHWGTELCDELFYRYLKKDRTHRQGFCPSVYKEILNLYILHASKYSSKYKLLDFEGLNVNT